MPSHHTSAALNPSSDWKPVHQHDQLAPCASILMWAAASACEGGIKGPGCKGSLCPVPRFRYGTRLDGMQCAARLYLRAGSASSRRWDFVRAELLAGDRISGLLVADVPSQPCLVIMYDVGSSCVT